MQSTKPARCPKCSGTEILKVPGKRGAYGRGNNIPVGTFGFGWVEVTRTVCCGCGFTEEWVDTHADIEALRRKYPRL